MITMRCWLCVCIILLGGCGGGGSDTPPPASGTPQNQTLTGILQKTDLPPPATLSATPANLPSFVAFESGQVRPLALSEDGRQLYAVNTPDNRLEVFSIIGATLHHVQSVPVGLEPVAVAVSGDQVWVVNHLSDSVSVVSVAQSPYRVIRTLLVGDEPRDIVFAGPGMSRAFITTAHRGQNTSIEPQLTTPGLGRADVVVFSRDNPGAGPGGEPLVTLTLFGDTPRALASNADGSRVYAAVFNSGNQTTVVRAIPTLNKAPPFANIEGITAPESAYILKFNGSNWVDEAGRHFDQQANLNLPDLDVFEIDTMGEVPRQVNEWAGVGTTLYNMVVSPVSGDVFVSNTEARNHVRFEGPGNNASTLRGNFVDSRLSLLRNDGSVMTQSLNPHIDRSRSTGTAAERELSLALPLEIAISRDGANLYMVAMGSNKIAVIPAVTIGTDTFQPAAQTHITVSGGGPTGIVLDEPRNQAYVLTRFDNGISVIDLASESEIAHVKMYNPEPPSIITGRKFLYDAALTSSTGDSACALCHVFADTDHLSWDLGNPDDIEMTNPFGPVPFSNPINGR
ncbi:MAG: hypothetical protein HKN70_14130, partial [Gammaproteobacteria bacterium]|nr:hypothetical protein [Gammaproteobacteria bacterium]